MAKDFSQLTLEEIRQYGDAGSYLSDDFAGLQEMHATFWPLYEQYIDLANAFIEQLWAVDEGRNDYMMQMYKDEGFQAHYLYGALIDKGQEIQDAIYLQGIDDSNLIELDLDALQELYDEFNDLAGQSLEVTEEQIDLEGGQGVLKENFDFVITDVQAALNDLFDRVRSQSPVDEEEIGAGFAVTGSVSAFEEQMGTLVDRYNMLWETY